MTSLLKDPKLNSTPMRRENNGMNTSSATTLGRIGNAKQALSLNQNNTKLQGTSENWIAATLLELNLCLRRPLRRDFLRKPYLLYLQ